MSLAAACLDDGPTHLYYGDPGGASADLEADKAATLYLSNYIPSLSGLPSP